MPLLACWPSMRPTDRAISSVTGKIGMSLQSRSMNRRRRCFRCSSGARKAPCVNSAIVTTESPSSVSPQVASTCSRICKTLRPLRSAAMIMLESRITPIPAESTACGCGQSRPHLPRNQHPGQVPRWFLLHAFGPRQYTPKRSSAWEAPYGELQAKVSHSRSQPQHLHELAP